MGGGGGAKTPQRINSVAYSKFIFLNIKIIFPIKKGTNQINNCKLQVDIIQVVVSAIWFIRLIETEITYTRKTKIAYTQ